MASQAAMLLDPRGYKRQLEGDGNDSESPSEPLHFREISTSGESNSCHACLSSPGRTPSPEHPTDLGAASSIRSHGEQQVSGTTTTRHATRLPV